MVHIILRCTAPDATPGKKHKRKRSKEHKDAPEKKRRKLKKRDTSSQGSSTTESSSSSSSSTNSKSDPGNPPPDAPRVGEGQHDSEETIDMIMEQLGLKSHALKKKACLVMMCQIVEICIRNCHYHIYVLAVRVMDVFPL